MASPQKEDGYTAIANEIMEALSKYRIPGEQMQCLLFILRKTYGFNKKWDAIANSQLVRATGLRKQHVYRAIKGLIDKNLVTKKGYNPAISYCFNKNYKTWKVYPKKVTVTNIGKKSNQKRGPQKTLYKRHIDEIINFLNETTGKNYKKNTKSTAKHIIARLKEGFSLDDFKTVIKNKTKEWKNTDMAKYLRPETLFGTKFESYLQSVKSAKKLYDIDGKELTPEKIKEMRDG